MQNLERQQIQGVWVNSPNRYVKDGTCIDGADDPLADLYWKAGGVEATPKAETLTKYKELTNMSDNEKTEIDKNPGQWQLSRREQQLWQS